MTSLPTQTEPVHRSEPGAASGARRAGAGRAGAGRAGSPVLRRVRRAVAGLAAALALGLPAAQAPAAGAAIDGDLTVLQLNLCGSGFASCWTGRAVPVAAGVIRDRAPQLVTLNEICAGDLPVLRRALADGHGAGSVATAFTPALDRRTRAAIRCRDGRPYGIGVLAWTPFPGARTQVSHGTFRAQDPRQPEQRVWLCLTLRAGAAAGVTGCSTHLSSGGTRVATAQCRELVGLVPPGLPADDGDSGGAALVVGGDLNLAGPLPAGCAPAGYRQAGMAVQHVLARGLTVREVGAVDLQASTDHPGLLAVLHRG
jgi:hypothetical protein